MVQSPSPRILKVNVLIPSTNEPHPTVQLELEPNMDPLVELMQYVVLPTQKPFLSESKDLGTNVPPPYCGIVPMPRLAAIARLIHIADQLQNPSAISPPPYEPKT